MTRFDTSALPGDGEFSTLVDLARDRALRLRDKRAYSFIGEGGIADSHLSYAELDAKARAVGAWLQSQGATGQPVLLLYPPGLDYVAAIFGCFYAGAVAVPAYPPRKNRSLARLELIVRDTRAAVALTTSSIMSNVQGHLSADSPFYAMRWLTSDTLDAATAEDWRPPKLEHDSAAVLQYTSGSTADPKGVILTHGGLLHNLRLIHDAFGHTPASHGVIWLPPYHDMGLIGGILQPCYYSGTVTLMSPTSFLQRPFRWLEAVSRERATTSGGPDFAFELCVRSITPDQRATLDLSSWSVAFCGAEPIRQTTIDRFTEAFAPCGFRPESFFPCYGLAEATLFVSGGPASRSPIALTVDREALMLDRVVESAPGATSVRVLVGCGQVGQDTRIEIIRPEAGSRCAVDEVGEIWLASPSVAAGYWNRADESREVFGARVDTGEGPFLRTGDLGFVREGELFVTGRLKDLLVIRGRNFYPQDIELTLETAQPMRRPGSVVAFSADLDGTGEERLVVVQETSREKVDIGELARLFRHVVARDHDLALGALLLVERLSIPKTSSGKLQRRACHAAFLNRALPVVDEWRASALSNLRNPAVGAAVEPEHAVPLGSPKDGSQIMTWLVMQIAAQLRMEAAEITVDEPFVSFGMDSLQAAHLARDLGTWLGRETSATLIYEFPTIALLAQHLSSEGPVARERSLVVSDPTGERAPRFEPVAIIGIGCRFPGADGPDSFWRLLRDGVDSVGEVPSTRWDLTTFYDPDPASPGKMSTRWGGFLERIDYFDPLFFGISPREAARIDPQQRLLLEVAWEALEDAGQAADRLAGSATGVFVGISTNDYGQLQLSDPAFGDAYIGTGSASSIAANRISYTLDFTGPSIAIDTACSSSLVAVHLACQSLQSGESTLALAGGVNVLLSPALTVSFTKAGFMAPDGRCKAFDARADGYVRSEGAGAVVLKPLSRALADGDPIYAVIRGSAVNQDGRSNGLTAPSGLAQEAVIRECYRRAGISPGQVQYVEAHGTGTALGDPIEAAALGNVLGAERGSGNRCAIGSVKSNIGHLEAAAGIAGLIKVALSMRHRTLPPTLHFHEPNPRIPFDRLPLRVQRVLEPWRNENGPRLAGVSSFGFGGTNAHVLVGEAPAQPAEVGLGDIDETDVYLLPLSARSLPGLHALAGRYGDFLASDDSASLADICHSAAVRRSQLDYRLAIVGRSRGELRAALDRSQITADDPDPGVRRGRKHPHGIPPVVWVFSGQATQWAGMGCDLLDSEPVFREAVHMCDDLLARHVGWSLVDELRADKAKSRLRETVVAQPAIFAVQVGLAGLYRSWGISPDAVVGHSVGEVAAAHIAGVLNIEDAVTVVAHRSRLMQPGAGRGQMAAVGLPDAEIERLISRFDGLLSVAAVNDPTATVVSGEPQALRELLAELEPRGIFCALLDVDFAFHSGQMEAYGGELERALVGITPRIATIPLVSTVTGQLATGLDLDATYWAREIREPVRFAAAMETLIHVGHRTFLEIGSHSSLSGSIAKCLKQSSVKGLALGTLRRDGDSALLVRSALGALWAIGREVSWDVLFPKRPRHTRLPTYPWQRERHWLTSSNGPSVDGNAQPRVNNPGTLSPHSLLGRRLPELAESPGVVNWESEVHCDLSPYISAHRVDDSRVLPATVYIEMLLSAAEEAYGPGPHRLTNIEFSKMLLLPDHGTRRIQVALAPAPSGDATVRLYARGDDQKVATSLEAHPWNVHAIASVQRGERPSRSARSSDRRQLDFGLMFFAATEDALGDDRYRLVIEAARYADAHGFYSVLVPERHFSKLGCLYPNPAVLHAALSRETKRVKLRAGSVVLPLHNPIRVVEEWAMVDNLSAGRVELSFASGWNPTDFAFFPDRYADRHAELMRGVDVVRRLWRGETISVTNGVGERVDVRTYPTPVQPTLPIWITAAGTPETFAGAGRMGAHLLTHLLDQDLDVLADRIGLYRRSRAEGGFDPNTGRVAVMLHTFLGDELEVVREQVRKPYCDYLKSVAHLLTAFAQSKGRPVDVRSLSPDELDEFVNFLFERFFSTRALLGTPESCVDLTRKLETIGVDEIACLLDFGPSAEAVLSHLPHLDRLRQMCASTGDDALTVGTAPHEGLDTIRRRCSEEIDGAMFLAAIKGRGISDIGSAAIIDRVWRRDGESLGYIRNVASAGGQTDLSMRPEILATCLQVLLAALPNWRTGLSDESAEIAQLDYVPTGIELLELGPLDTLEGVWSHTRVRSGGGPGEAALSGDVLLLDARGQKIAEAIGVRFRRLSTFDTSTVRATEGDIDALMYEHRWVPQTQAPIASVASYAPVGARLILADTGGVGDGLAARWRAQGVPCSVVTFAQTSGSGAPDVEAAVALLSQRPDDLPIADVVHLWSLDDALSDSADDVAIEQAQARGIRSILHFVQAAAGGSVVISPRFWLVTRGAQSVGAAPEAVAVDQAPIWGFGRVVAAELPAQFGGLIDLCPRASVADATSQLADAIALGARADQIAIRDGRRFVPRLSRRVPRERRGRMTLRGDCRYLITGGTGDLGLAVARWMVERGARHLVLVGRSAEQARSEERASISEGSPAATIEMLEKQFGATVRLASVDVSDSAQLESLLTSLERDGGPPIRGVVHAAGVVRGATLLQMSDEALQAVLKPKVTGAWLLHRAFETRPLDFFVLFSAIPSLLGWLGQGASNYAAANAFLDALAHRRRARGLPSQSITWGPWSEIGMAARAPGGLARLGEWGILGITPAQASMVLDQLFGDDPVQTAVVSVDWRQFLSASGAAAAPLLAELADEVAERGEGGSSSTETLPELHPLPSRDELVLDPRRGRTILEQHFADQVGRVLKLQPSDVAIDEPLTRLGLDSLVAIELRTHIQTRLGVQIPLATLLQGASIRALAEHVMGEIEVPAGKTIAAASGSPNELGRPFAPGRAELLLARLNELSDSEVNSLLEELSASEGDPA